MLHTNFRDPITEINSFIYQHQEQGDLAENVKLEGPEKQAIHQRSWYDFLISLGFPVGRLCSYKVGIFVLAMYQASGARHFTSLRAKRHIRLFPIFPKFRKVQILGHFIPKVPHKQLSFSEQVPKMKKKGM